MFTGAIGPVGVLEKLPSMAKKGIVAVCLLGLFGLFIAMCIAPPQDVYPSSDPRSVDVSVDDLDPGSTAWMLASSALVLIMTPGLAFFYGGMINHKNVVGTIAACIIPMAIIPLVWSFIGYSLAFGTSAGYPDIIGTPETYGLMYNIGIDSSSGYPTSTNWIFQGMFAIITPAILIGSIADRVNFPSLCLFVPLWHMGVYCPVAHMVWGGGMINRYGILDFAGGMVVHMSSGWGALAAAIFLGPAVKQSNEGPANPAYVVLGASLLWFGWYGFNGGSALAANQYAAHAFLNTTLATAVSMITWVMFDQLRGKTFKVTGMCLGIVVGLVAITPACGLVSYGAAMIIGFFGAVFSALAQWGMELVGKARADDTLDVFACHGIGGTTGMILTSLFQDTEAGAGHEGSFYGNSKEIGKTMIVLLCLVGYYLLATYILMFITNIFIGMRVSEEEEEEGLDFSKHYEGPSKGDEDA